MSYQKTIITTDDIAGTSQSFVVFGNPIDRGSANVSIHQSPGAGLLIMYQMTPADARRLAEHLIEAANAAAAPNPVFDPRSRVAAPSCHRSA